MAFWFCGFVIVEGFLGVPRFYVGAHCLSSRNGAVDAHLSFMQLAPFHVGICNLNLQSCDCVVESIRDEETFEIACYSLVEAVEVDVWADFFC